MNLTLAALAKQELERRRAEASPLIDLSFPKQADFVKDPSTFVGACCTRRSGKTVGLAYKYINKAKKHSNVMMPYIALTRESAKNIMWPVFQELNAKHNIGGQFVESELSYKISSDKVIKLFGADMTNFMERLRGIKTPLAGIDEGQSFRNHIEQLVDDILTPAISDYPDGQLALTGTPGPIPKGYFYDVTAGKMGFSLHNWKVYDNPYMPNAREFVKNLMIKKGWDEKNPTYRREWQGEWVPDEDGLVYKFNSERNLIDSLPKDNGWFYVLGVDLGYDPDPSGFVLCCFNFYDRHMYIVDTYKQNKMTVSDVAERIKYYLKMFPSLKIVIDAGAQGKMIAEEMKQRYAIPLEAAEKHGKAGFIEIMNADLIRGLIKVVREVSGDLVDEWQNLIWDSEKEQRVEDSRYPNHLSDAALYAWRYCYNYAHSARPDVIAPNTEKAIDQWWEREAEKLGNQRSEESDLYGY